MARASKKASVEAQGVEAKEAKVSLEDEIMNLRKALADQEKKANEYLERLKYLQAEFDNYRKGVERERAEFIKRANEGLILKLLDVYESLEKVLGDARDKEAIDDGVKLVYEEFKQVLDREGMKAINAVGEKFDPFKHEAIMVEKNETKEPNTVVEEYQRGYLLGDKVLRYSKVKVTTR